MSAVLERVRSNEFIVMDRSGDTKTIWNPDNADEVEIARNTFSSFKRKGYLIYRVDKKGDKGQQMHEFDPNAEKMIAVPPVVGG